MRDLIKVIEITTILYDNDILCMERRDIGCISRLMKTLSALVMMRKCGNEPSSPQHGRDGEALK